MATEAEINDLKLYLKQLDGHADEDPFLSVLIDSARSIVEEYLGFAFDGYTSSTVMRVQSWGTQSLRLPPHDPASIFIVKYEGDATVLADWQYDADTGMLLRTATYPSKATWPLGRYEVTGNWGYGTEPEPVQQVVRELAKTLFFERDARSTSDIVGIEGSGGVAVGYKGALTKRQSMILSSVKRRLNPGVVFA